MTSDESNRLFEISAGPDGEPFEEDGLRQRTDFQSRAPRAGADFKDMSTWRSLMATSGMSSRSEPTYGASIGYSEHQALSSLR